MKKLINILLAGFITVLYTSCNREASVVPPTQVNTGYIDISPGTTIPQIKAIYPSGSGISRTASVVVVFSKPVNTATVDANTDVVLTDALLNVVTLNNPTFSADNTIATFTYAGMLLNNTAYTVTVNPGIDAADGPAMTAGGTGTFTTIDKSLETANPVPKILSAARYPDDATLFSRTITYVEITFSEPINPATLNLGTFTINGNIGGITSVSVVNTAGNTYRLNINNATVNYGETVTVSLQSGITSATGVPVDLTGGTWSFTIEPDPAQSITSLWFGTVTPTGVTVNFTTAVPVEKSRCYALWDTMAVTADTTNEVQEAASTEKTTTHTIIIPDGTFNPSTVYYINGGVDLDPVENGMEAGDTFNPALQVTLRTKTSTAAGINTSLSKAVNDQSKLRTVQLPDGSSYAFWTTAENGAGNLDITGQFFNTAGTAQWGLAGTAICSAAGNQDYVSVINSRYTNNDAILVYLQNTDLYGKMVYENTGIQFGWGGAAGSSGLLLANNAKSITPYALALVHEKPTRIIANQIMERPAAGYPANLLFDRDTDFSSLGLADLDMILLNNAGTWGQGVIYSADSWGVFRHVLRTSLSPSLNAYSFYFGDPVNYYTGPGTVDSVVSANHIEANDAFLSGVAVGDNIDCAGSVKKITNIFKYRITTAVNHGLADGNYFSIQGTADSGAGTIFTANDSFLSGVKTAFDSGDTITIICYGTPGVTTTISNITGPTLSVYTITTAVSHNLILGDNFSIRGTVDDVISANQFGSNDAFLSGVAAGVTIICSGTTAVNAISGATGVYNLATSTAHGLMAGNTFTQVGNVDTAPTVTTFTANDPFLASVSTGDIINCNGAVWVIVSAKSAGPPYTITTDVNHGLSAGNYFIIYPRIAGPYTSELVYNGAGPYYPLWDNNPATFFNPGTTVQAGDYVINANGFTAAATYATVAAIDASKDNNYAVRVNADILNNGDYYGIVRLPSGAAFVTVGYATTYSSFAVDDSNSPFGPVQAGDIIYNIESDLAAEVITKVSNSSLTLSADIFTAANQKFIVYRKRGVLAAYIDANDDLYITVRNIADGSQISVPVQIAAGTYRNPYVVSDEAGGAIIFYEDTSNNLYACGVSVYGNVSWSSGVIATGYSIIQVLPDKARYNAAGPDGRGGAYLLAYNNTTHDIRLYRYRGDTGAQMWVRNYTGYNPQMVVDKLSASASRVIIVNEGTHTVSTDTYYHIRMRGYDSAGTVVIPDTAVTNDTTATYYCVDPVVIVSENNISAADYYYITWYDGRYYSQIGYSLYSRQFDSAGAAQWPSEVFVSSPSSYGLSYPLFTGLLYYDDDLGVAPFGIIPLWLDYRDYTNTKADIYLDWIDDAGN